MLPVTKPEPFRLNIEERVETRVNKWQEEIAKVIYLQGVIKRCRLSLLTNSAPAPYTSPNAGGGGVAGSQPMSTAVHIT